MDTAKNYCPNCSQLYVLSVSHPKGNNLPLFLTCGHTMCEKCITNIVKFGEPIECKVCHRDMALEPDNVTLITQNNVKLYEFFPLNVHMVGELYLHNLGKPTEKKGSNECFLNLKALLKEVESTEGECLECHNLTSKMCEQCQTPLCDSCFNKTHKNFVIFKNHFLKNIAPLGVSNECSTHKGKPLDYYCHDCVKAICMDCMMVGGANSCKNHNTVSIQEVNEQVIEELSNVSPKIDEIFRRLTKTAVDIGQLLYNIENETQASCVYTQMIADVEQHFSKLDCQLQKHKQELVNLLNKYKSSDKESLIKAKMDVANAIKKAKTIMNTITASNDPTVLKGANLSALLQKAKEVIDTPWYLMKNETKEEPLKLVVKDDICNSVTDYVRLEGNSNSSYKLQSTNELTEQDIPAAPPAPVMPPELPKDVRQTSKAKQSGAAKPGAADAAPPPYVAFYKNAPNYRHKSESITSLNSLSSDSSFKSSLATGRVHNRPMVQPVSPFPDSQPAIPLLEGSQVVVYISHIVDPHNFFVQRSCHQSMVKEIIRAFRNAVSLPKPSVNHVAIEKVYLVYNKADNMWQRCRVIGIDKKDINKPLFQVFCFDFGSTEKVTVDELRLIPPARLHNPPPLAIHCSLANCMPTAGGWTSDDSYLIRNIIDNKQAVIHVRQMFPVGQSLKVDCDVITFEEGISLVHALVFHERARLVNPRLPYPEIAGIAEKPQIFMNNNDLKTKMVEEVYIINIMSPDKFFVRKQHLQEVFEKLCDDLDQEYSLGDNTGSIYLPEVGMVCVVNLDRYREAAGATGWARCVITETPGRGRVRVLLVDMGATLLVHWTQLRRISHKFTTLRALSIECHLAGVTPQNKKWNPRSVALLQQFCGVLLEMKVEDNRNRGSVGVSLYDKSDEENIVCINQEMIRHKYAVSFGLYSFNKNPVIENDAITNRAPVEQKPKPQKKTNKVTVLQHQKTSPKIKVNEKDLEAKDKGPVSLEAKILNYQSPSLIYISLVQQQQVFNELFEKIQKHYAGKKPPGKDDWKVGDRCCTICKASQTWRRGLIIDMEGSDAKVFYSDFACVEKVPMASLCELTPEFTTIGDAAIKCHLSGVVPAVGDEWPSLTKEFLKELLDIYKRIFITKVGNFKDKDKSLPIQIWVYHVIQGGALEPDKSEWRCLNQRIIEQGLGVPDKTQEATVTDKGDANSDVLSFLNVTGSVTEWLQLEPLPQVENKKCDVSSAASTPVAEGDCDEEPSSSNTMFITDWQPAETLASKEFTAVPTYVDNNGIIYLHDVSQEDTLDLIRKALDVRFKDPDPKAKYAKWSVGEPCIALYYLDNKFYRGRILEVNNEESTCLIHYIDYGNEEQCSFENLRKSIALYQLPIQAHKCVLNRIKPVGGQWNRLALDYMHKSIVEKHCFVKVTGEMQDGVVPIDLKYDKLWINDHLVEFEMAKYTDGSKVKVPKFVSKAEHISEIEVYDSGPDYIVDDEPAQSSTTEYDSFNMDSMKDKDWNQILEEEEMNKSFESFISYPKYTNEDFLCNIIVIDNLNLLQLSIIHDKTLIYEQLYEDINKNGENMSPLNGIFENKACIAIFPEDLKWCRASILQYSEAKNQIKVRFVDFGIVSVISLADVREIAEEWAKLPPATITAKLHGVKLNPAVDINVVSTEFINVFLEKGPFKVKVVDYDDSIPLVELRNPNHELSYADLIKKEILLPC